MVTLVHLGSPRRDAAEPAGEEEVIVVKRTDTVVEVPQLSVISYQLSVISYQLSVIGSEGQRSSLPPASNASIGGSTAEGGEGGFLQKTEN